MIRPAVALMVLTAVGILWFVAPSPPPRVPSGRGPRLPDGRAQLQPGPTARTPRPPVEASAPATAGPVVDRSLLPRHLPQIPAADTLVSGTLVEEDGGPAVDGWVRWVPVTSDGKRWGSEQVQAGIDGRFSLYVARADMVHIEGGSANSLKTPFALPLPSDGEAGTLRLIPGCTLAGRLERYGTVRPESLYVRAWRCEVFDTGHSDMQLPAVGDREFPDVGCEYLVASPDQDGNWCLNRLEPGTYVVEVGGADGARLHAGIRAPHRRVVRAPARGVDIRLSCAVTHIVPDHPGRRGDGVRELMVSFTDAAGRTSEVYAWYHCEWQGEEGNFSMALAPGETYRLRVWANGHRPLVMDHTAAAAGDESHVPVRLLPVPCGRLRIDPPDGRRTDGEYVQLELLETQSGERVHWQVLSPREARVCEVPQGAWTLAIKTWGAPKGQGGDFDLPEVRPIVVTADAEQVIQRQPSPGGRFTLSVDRPEGAAGPVSCLVERPGTKARPARLYVGQPGGAIVWSDLIAAGTAYAALDTYPPGNLTLLLASPGCKPVRLTVRIAAEQVTLAHVTMERL